MKHLIPLVLAVLGAPALAADYCRLYSNLNQGGSSKTYTLPGVDETFGEKAWSTSSRRTIGDELDTPGGAAVYQNAESARIVAADTGVELFLYTGGNMDGVFERLRCAQGNVCTWNFGSMRNKVKSLTCQRELGGTPIPTRDIANELTEELDAQMPASPSIDNSVIRYGQLLWTNYRVMLDRLGLASGWEDKYRDTLEYRGKFTLDIHPQAWTKKYDVWFRMWIEPRRTGTSKTLSFEENGLEVTVEAGLLSGQIADALFDYMDVHLYDGDQDLGQTITDQVHAAIEDVAGIFAPLIIQNNQRLYPAYECSGVNSGDHTLDYPGYTYTNYNLDHPCGYGMPVTAYAPIVRLVKQLGGP